MKKRTFIIIMAVVLLFIWGHSLLPQSSSAAESGWIMQIMQAVLDFLHIPVKLTQHIVRKLAHFTEYSGAGLLLGLYFFPRVKDEEGVKRKIRKAAMPFAAGLFIGFMDETVQLFSGRGALIVDVWIDFAGICFGAAISGAVLMIVSKIKKKKNAQTL